MTPELALIEVVFESRIEEYRTSPCIVEAVEDRILEFVTGILTEFPELTPPCTRFPLIALSRKEPLKRIVALDPSNVNPLGIL
jgi:hypothetical protein